MQTKTILKQLCLLTFPLVLSGLFQQLFSWVDAFMVGNLVGENALAAVGITGSVHTLFITLLIGFTSGLSILFAKLYGANDFAHMKDVLAEYVQVIMFLVLLISIVGIVFTPTILELLNTPEILYIDALEYTYILFIGVPFLALYNIYSSLLRAMGNSKTAFYVVLIASFINIILDYVFIAMVSLEVIGAAVATVLSQVLMGVSMVFYCLKKYPQLRFKLSLKRNTDVLWEGNKYGTPPAIQSGVFSIGNVILQRFMNGFGEHTVAAISTAYRIDSVLLLPINNFGTGVATLIAQNVGAKKEENIPAILKVGMIVMSVISILLTFAIIWIGETLLALFGLSSISVEIGKTFFRYIAIFYIVCGVNTVMRGYLEGLSDLVFTGIVGILSLLVRIVCSYTFVDFFGNMVIAYAEAFSWIFVFMVYFWRYMDRKRKEIR